MDDEHLAGWERADDEDWCEQETDQIDQCFLAAILFLVIMLVMRILA